MARGDQVEDAAALVAPEALHADRPVCADAHVAGRDLLLVPRAFHLDAVCALLPDLEAERLGNSERVAEIALHALGALAEVGTHGFPRWGASPTSRANDTGSQTTTHRKGRSGTRSRGRAIIIALHLAARRVPRYQV